MILPLNGEGHRQRTQNKVLKTEDMGTLADYEVLEALLMRSIPRIDVKPIAKELLHDFGSLSGVLYASPELLKQHKNVKESTLALFKLVLEINQRLSREKLQKKPVLQCWQQVMDYCYMALQGERIEQFLVLYLDTKLKLIHQETPQKGTTDRVSLYPREILKQALILGARAVVIAHNHPSGEPQPSGADLTLTTELYKMLQVSHIDLLDHLIIGANRNIYSFAAHGHFWQKERNLG